MSQAHDNVLNWCRGNGKVNGAIPCMREADGRCNVWDNSYIEPVMLFSGESWEQVWDEYCALRNDPPAPTPEPARPTYTRRGRRWGRR